MNILVVSATDFEVAPLIEKLHLKEKRERLSSYQFKNINVDILYTGIGIAFTTYHLTKQLLQNKYDMVVNAGIAGSFSTNLKLGEVVNVCEEQFADLGVESKNSFNTLFDESLMNSNTFPFKDGKLINPSDINKYSQLKNAVAITVNTVNGNRERIDKIVEKFNPEIESMEGGAFFYVCMQESVSFMQIRSISNYVEQRNKDNWNMPIAIKNLNSTLISIFEALNSKP